MLLSYSFTLLADDGPNSIFSVAAGVPSVNDQGMAKFHATLRSTGADGVFTRDMNGELGIIAVTSDQFKAFPISGGINDAGTVSFGAALKDGTQAIFTGQGAALSRIADTGPDSPFESFLPPAANINNDELVAFRATLKSGGTAILIGSADEPSRTLYVTGGLFTALLSQNLSRNRSDVVFRAALSTGGEGIFRGDGTETTTIATTGGTYRAFSASTMNDAGTAAFEANLTAGGQAVVTGDGTQFNTVADTSGPYGSFFGNVALNNDGQVVFAANLAVGGSGIFIAQDHDVHEIIGTGDRLFGSTVTSFTAVPFAPVGGLNNEGQVAFVANLADGREVIVRADPEDADAAYPAQDLAGGRTVIARADATIVPNSSANVAVALPGAGRLASTGTGSGAALAAAGNSPDDSRFAVAAALNASSRPLALAPTQTAPTPANVERLDHLFAAGLEDGTSLALLRSKRDLLSFSDEDGLDADF
jgi:hypothetical protein